jgi:hypothetical protein
VGKFKAGAPKKGGRKKGTPNKLAAGVKAALVEAFDELGGVPALVGWGRKNPSHFYALWSKLLSTEVRNAAGESFRLTFGDEVRRRLDEVDGDRRGRPGEAGGAESPGVAAAEAQPQ